MTAFKVIVSILSVVVLIANGVVCTLVFVHRHLRTHTNGFIVSLAMSDILVGITLFLHYALNVHGPLALNVLYTTSLLASVTNLTAVTFDRHLACTQPFNYSNIIAKHFTKIVVFCWIAAVTTSLLPLSWANSEPSSAALALHVYQVCILILGIAAPFVWIFFSYLRIFRQVSKIVKREKKIAKSVMYAHEPCERGRRVCSEAKIAKILSVIAVMFVLSWLPIIWTTLVYAIGQPRLFPEALKYVSPLTLALGSIVNPVLYSLKKPDFRHVCNRMCCFILTPRISFDGNNVSAALNSKNAFTQAATITKSPSTVPLKLMEQRHDLQSKDNSTNELLTQD